MIDKEIEIVNEEFIKREDTYNITLGGYGLGRFSNEMRLEIFKKSSITQKEKYMNGTLIPRFKEENLSIFNKDDEVEYTFKLRDMIKICEKYDLPYRSFIKSYSQHGTPLYIYQKSRKNKDIYKGWYCLSESDKRINIENYMETYFIKKEEVSEKMKIKDNFRNCRYVRKGGYYSIFNDKGILEHVIFGNVKKRIKKLKLPPTLYLTKLKNNVIKIGKYKGWYLRKSNP